jgi:hypothetical protein
MIEHTGRTLRIDGLDLDLPYPISDAFELADRVIVLFDPDAYRETPGQFPNLIAVSRSGTMLWTAELPTTTAGDRYYKIASRTPLLAYSIYSLECAIDPLTGHIKARREFK